MFEIGRIAVKIAGRDAGKKCVVVDVLDKTFVLIDGDTRRRKCNIAHLEPLQTVISIAKGASHEEVKKEFDKLGLKVRDTKPKDKNKPHKPAPEEKKPEPKKKAKNIK
ncbi:MAG TPA: 50S ribosomal protein L14e [Candidatus Nanoarchaeia archaeon]|nr:50S ribosomal protein L14e [Candidatus Nanoarchaeia archaeon]